MHEYSIVAALLERVNAEARAKEASRVHRLTVRIGELAGVDVRAVGWGGVAQRNLVQTGSQCTGWQRERQLTARAR